jgi:hypothetical protein
VKTGEPIQLDGHLCRCGHLDGMHLYVEKGKRAGTRTKCQTATGPAFRACECVAFDLVASCLP